MISGKEIKVIDINSEFYGIPNFQLMENAGKGLAEFIEKKINLITKTFFLYVDLETMVETVHRIQTLAAAAAVVLER